MQLTTLCLKVDVIMQYRGTKIEVGQLIAMEMPELFLETPILQYTIGKKYPFDFP